jgi:hypothetical protein
LLSDNFRLLFENLQNLNHTIISFSKVCKGNDESCRVLSFSGVFVEIEGKMTIRAIFRFLLGSRLSLSSIVLPLKIQSLQISSTVVGSH